MGSRLKEDERNERTIRNLLKLPENRRCINCNSLGPQYVCTSFWTFVCTTCSGIHREFTHRVKSVSMAKFTTQEVSALQGGGNASAKEIYFKEWDAQRQSFPDSSNVERLRDFIKHVYVDRRYSGERSFDKPPRAKMGETAEDTYQGGSRSPPYENERRYSDRPSPGGRSDTSSRNSYDERRSPEYNQSQDFKKSSPARSDVVNDWRREDRFSKTPDLGRSPDRQKDISSPPPLVRPVREILGESVSPLRVIEPPPKTNGGSTSLQPQRTASSSSLASSNGNPPVTELRRESSLIDFDTDDPQPTPSTASVSVPQTQQVPPSVPVSLNHNWANFDSTPTPVVTKPMPSSQAPSSGGNLLDMLSELSVPASGNNPQVSLFGTNPPPPPHPHPHPHPAAVASPSAFVPGGGPAAPPPFDAFGNSGGGPQWQNVLPQLNVIQPPALFNQAPSVDSHVTSKPAAKQELPADLFTSSYSPFGGQGAPGWYPAPQYGMGFNMQYNVPMQQHMPPAFGQPPRSANPFDVNESPAVQPPTMFPSMAPLQNALPTMGPPPSGLQQTWMPPQPSHPLATPPYGSSMPSGPFMGQPPPNIPSQPQPQSRGQVGNFGYALTSLGSMNNPNQQQQSGLYTQTPTPTPNTFSSNPFG